jgi:NADH-quinone oxidoreductase subunit M
MVFYITSSGISINSYLFIALIWGNGDVEERKSSGEILYLHLSRIFIYANCFCLFVPKAGSLLEDLYKLIYQQRTIWIFCILLSLCIKIPLFLSILGKQMC